MGLERGIYERKNAAFMGVTSIRSQGSGIQGPAGPGAETISERESILNLRELPRSAYIHVPFCRHRCGYCNFALVTGRDDLIEPYLAALERELSSLGEPREVDTLF